MLGLSPRNLELVVLRGGNSTGWDGHSAETEKRPESPEKGLFFKRKLYKWNPTMNFQGICWFLRECTHFIGNFVWPTVGSCHVYITDRNWDFILQNVANIGECFYTVFVVNGEIHTPPTIPQVLCKFLDTHLE